MGYTMARVRTMEGTCVGMRRVFCAHVMNVMGATPSGGKIKPNNIIVTTTTLNPH